MTKIAIRVENLSKQYRIGKSQARYNTFRDTLTNALVAPFRRASMLLRGQPYGAAELEQTIWALKDVSFEIEHGKVLGIIGRNGAGKSTLLKIISRITDPTQGKIDIYGRVGALLEVGTGFHPELTGRENIYLNGSILGMRRVEVERKFEEIVEFSGVEKFIDTPVKHYSSGMYMRLAFSVAAHLEPDILLVDEVLAVGDTAFQKKCLGKMQDVSREGRTVLFVSHNMAAVTNLCENALLLHSGEIIQMGSVTEVVQEYLSSQDRSGSIALRDRRDRKGDGQLKIVHVSLADELGNLVDYFQSGQDSLIELHYEVPSGKQLRNVLVSISIDSIWGQRLCVLQTDYVGSNLSEVSSYGKIICHIPKLPLLAGLYYFTLFVTSNGVIVDWVQRAGSIRVESGDYYGFGKYPELQDGPMLIEHNWKMSSQ